MQQIKMLDRMKRMVLSFQIRRLMMKVRRALAKEGQDA